MACCGSSSREDNCACVCCGYPNGATQLVFAQTVLFFGMILSVASMSDCEFVVADVFPEVLPSLNNGTVANATELPGELGDYLDGNRRGMGFFFFETADGECNYDAFNADILDWYWDFLGSNWRIPRAFGSVAATIGWLLWFWSLSFACAAHPRIFRYVMAFYHIAVFGLFQFLTLLILGSDFCDDRECELGRSAILSIVSGSCFVVSGMLFFCMNDFPGPRKPIGRAAPVVEATKKSISQDENVQIDDEKEGAVVPSEQEIQEKPEIENTNAALAETSKNEDEEQETTPDDEQCTKKTQDAANESFDDAEGGADYSEEEIEEEEEVTEYEEIEEVTDDRESTEESESMEILEAIEEVQEESSSRGV